MPRRSDRETFGEKVFGSNPFEGKSPEEVFKEIQWDNDVEEIFEIEAPEPLACMGNLASIHYKSGVQEVDEGTYKLAIGTKSNLIYLVPVIDGYPVDVPDFYSSSRGWKKGQLVLETHYVSKKGGDEEFYYYHEHEEPYPRIWAHESTGVCILVPSNYNGRRSYAVVKEGIIG